MLSLIALPVDPNGDVPTLLAVGSLMTCINALRERMNLRGTAGVLQPRVEQIMNLVNLGKPVARDNNRQYWITALPLE